MFRTIVALVFFSTACGGSDSTAYDAPSETGGSASLATGGQSATGGQVATGGNATGGQATVATCKVGSLGCACRASGVMCDGTMACFGAIGGDMATGTCLPQ